MPLPTRSPDLRCRGGRSSAPPRSPPSRPSARRSSSRWRRSAPASTRGSTPRPGGVDGDSSTPTAHAFVASEIALGAFLTAFPEGADPRSAAAPVVDRAHPRGDPRPPGRAQWLGAARHPRLLQDLHPRRLRGLALPLPDVAGDLGRTGARLPVPLLDVRRRAGGRSRSSGRRHARCRSCRSRSRPTAPSSRADRSRATQARRGGGCGSDAVPARARGPHPRRLAPRARGRALRLPRSLDVPVRRDRAVLLPRAGRDGRLPDVLVRPEPRDDDVSRRLRTARGLADVDRVPLDRGSLARHPGRAARPPDAPLGCPRLRRRARPAHAARVLHRSVPQAARSQLVPRARPC